VRQGNDGGSAVAPDVSLANAVFALAPGQGAFPDQLDQRSRTAATTLASWASRIRQRPVLAAGHNRASLRKTPDARQHAIVGRGHHQTQQAVCRTDHRRAEASDSGSGLHGVQRHRSQRRSRTSWCADARLETCHVWEAGCGREGDARGAACCAGYPTQGAGLGGRERSGVSEVATHRGFWPGGTTSRVHCVRPSTRLSRSWRHYLVHNLR